MLTVRYQVCYNGEIFEGEVQAPDNLGKELYLLIARGMLFRDRWYRYVLSPRGGYQISIIRPGEIAEVLFTAENF